MADDVLEQLMAYAVYPSQKSKKAPKTSKEKFIEALDAQRAKFTNWGKPDFKANNTNWFRESEGGFLVHFGRKIIPVTLPNGKKTEYFRADQAFAVNDIFDLGVKLVETNEEFAALVEEQYGPKKPEEVVEPPPAEKTKRTRGKNKPKSATEA